MRHRNRNPITHVSAVVCRPAAGLPQQPAASKDLRGVPRIRSTGGSSGRARSLRDRRGGDIRTSSCASAVESNLNLRKFVEKISRPPARAARARQDELDVVALHVELAVHRLRPRRSAGRGRSGRSARASGCRANRRSRRGAAGGGWAAKPLSSRFRFAHRGRCRQVQARRRDGPSRGRGDRGRAGVREEVEEPSPFAGSRTRARSGRSSRNRPVSK